MTADFEAGNTMVQHRAQSPVVFAAVAMFVFVCALGLALMKLTGRR
jgi:hypothetical protein